MDLLFVETIAAELALRIGRSRIDRIYQPTAESLVFHLWTGSENVILYFCAGRAPRLSLIDSAPVNPPSPHRFCQLLRARLGRIVAVEQPPGERVVQLRCQQGEELLSLVFELFGSGNVLLLDANENIVDLFYRRDGQTRQLLPGAAYALPRREKRFDLRSDAPLPDAAEHPAGWERAFTPFSPLAHRGLENLLHAGLSPRQVLTHYRQAVNTPAGKCVMIDAGGEQILLPFLLPGYSKERVSKEFDSASAAFAALYAAPANALEPLRRQLLSLLQGREDKIARREQRIAAEIFGSTAEEAESLRQNGDLLLAQLHLLRRGMPSVTVTDWYADPPAERTLELDPLLTPQENAQRYFVQAAKYQRKILHQQRRQEESRAEAEEIAELIFAVSEALDLSELLGYQTELIRRGWLATGRKPKDQQGRRPRADRLLESKSSHGYRLIWGREQQGNDQVSRRLTAADDLWFHASGQPGAHLVLKRDGRSGEIPTDDIVEAAALAAGYSRGRHAARVEVIVADGDQVRPASGSPPGRVTLGRYRTVTVAPRRLDA